MLRRTPSAAPVAARTPLITHEVNGKQFIAAAAGDNNPAYQVTGENTIVVLGLKP